MMPTYMGNYGLRLFATGNENVVGFHTMARARRNEGLFGTPQSFNALRDGSKRPGVMGLGQEKGAKW